MTPERLVTVTVFSSPELAAPEMRKLTEAGLQPYLGGDYYRYHDPVELRVPESQVDRALKVLDLEPEGSEEESRSDRQLRACPECRTGDTLRLPPYALYALVASGVSLIAAALLRNVLLGFGAPLGWIAAMWLSRKSGCYRCRKCGHEWKPD